MAISKEQFESWLTHKEDEHVEFKEAKQHYDIENVKQYCIALANERGGHLVLGVANKIPRVVVGTNAFQNVEKVKQQVYDGFRMRVDVEEFVYGGKRVLVFKVPSRPIGRPLEYRGAYVMRVGESLVPMTGEQIKRILDEAVPDFSATMCEGATLSDLEPDAVESLRGLWLKKSGNEEIRTYTVEQLLSAAELFVDGKLNYAALILLGKHQALGKYLGNSEVVYEFRFEEDSIPADIRKDFRQGFFAIHDELWRAVNERNAAQHIQEGLFVRDIPSFNEEVVREALLNAVCHRDYQLQGSVFLRHYPKLLVIESPGGFPLGVTPSNILSKQNPTNKRIAEVFQKCGLVERSGQGADKMFRRCIEEAKPRPDYSSSDEFSVVLKLKAVVQDPMFLQFLEKVSAETRTRWSVDDLVLLDDVRQGVAIAPEFRSAVEKLKNLGVVESVGSGRGTKLILSRKYYAFVGKKGVYTRKRGLASAEKAALIIKHLETNGQGTIQEFEQMFQSLTREQIYSLLKRLKKEGKIERRGPRKTAAWHLKR